jgi:arginase
MDIELIGAGFNSSGHDRGVARAPLTLRSAGLVEGLRRHRGVHDAGDVAFAGMRPERGPKSRLLAEDALVSMVPGVQQAVGAASSRDRFPLVIGGDCPVLLGTLAADRGAALLFVDGHEDAWPPWSSPTGEAADCELGLAIGSTTTDLPDELGRLLPLLRPEAVAMLGPRDAEDLARHDVPSLRGSVWLRSDEELSGHVADETQAALEHLKASAERFWLHVDLDVLSTASLAAVDYQQPGGLSWDELTDLTGRALADPGCVGWSVVIYNPDLDPGGHGARDIVSYMTTASADLDNR